jgi:hypothetical protein
MKVSESSMSKMSLLDEHLFFMPLYNMGAVVQEEV